MKKVCAWCNKNIDADSSEPCSDGIISHGMCDDCYNKFLWPNRSEVVGLLDTIDVPVLMIEPSGDISTANKSAQALLQKEIPSIARLKGGIVFECVFAKLAEGCGNTVHCDGCTIRNTVMDTFQSGKSHLKVPAGLTRGTANKYTEIQFLISTEKVKDIVLLRIDKVN